MWVLGRSWIQSSIMHLEAQNGWEIKTKFIDSKAG